MTYFQAYEDRIPMTDLEQWRCDHSSTGEAAGERVWKIQVDRKRLDTKMLEHAMFFARGFAWNYSDRVEFANISVALGLHKVRAYPEKFQNGGHFLGSYVKMHRWACLDLIQRDDYYGSLCGFLGRLPGKPRHTTETDTGASVESQSQLVKEKRDERSVRIVPLFLEDENGFLMLADGVAATPSAEEEVLARLEKQDIEQRLRIFLIDFDNYLENARASQRCLRAAVACLVDTMVPHHAEWDSPGCIASLDPLAVYQVLGFLQDPVERGQGEVLTARMARLMDQTQQTTGSQKQPLLKKFRVFRDRYPIASC